MVVDERSRHELYSRLEEVLGPVAATTLIEYLPPVGWADVATKHDLAAVEQRLEQRLELRFDLVDERFGRMEESIKAATSDLRATFEHEMRSQAMTFGEETRSQAMTFGEALRLQGTNFEEALRLQGVNFGEGLRAQTTTMIFALVGVVLTMAALAFALARFP